MNWAAAGMLTASYASIGFAFVTVSGLRSRGHGHRSLAHRKCTTTDAAALAQPGTRARRPMADVLELTECQHRRLLEDLPERQLSGSERECVELDCQAFRRGRHEAKECDAQCEEGGDANDGVLYGRASPLLQCGDQQEGWHRHRVDCVARPRDEHVARQRALGETTAHAAPQRLHGRAAELRVSICRSAQHQLDRAERFRSIAIVAARSLAAQRHRRLHEGCETALDLSANHIALGRRRQRLVRPQDGGRGHMRVAWLRRIDGGEMGCQNRLRPTLRDARLELDDEERAWLLLTDDAQRVHLVGAARVKGGLDWQRVGHLAGRVHEQVVLSAR
eukprot:7229047-Prymnesium_polylepis.2